jgi:hypothetical protein
MSIRHLLDIANPTHDHGYLPTRSRPQNSDKYETVERYVP